MTTVERIPRVLVVDDDEEVRRLIVRFLSQRSSWIGFCIDLLGKR